LSGKPPISERAAKGEGRSKHRGGAEQRQAPCRPDCFARRLLVDWCHEWISNSEAKCFEASCFEAMCLKPCGLRLELAHAHYCRLSRALILSVQQINST
jgi:hypothetical protein